MFLSIATTHHPATDLGFLLMKHPDRLHQIDLSFGKAVVFFPQADENRCEATLIADIDPVALVRGKGQGDGILDQYVNDRPYVASSFLSVAIARVLASALAGTSKGRPEMVDQALPLVARITVLPCRGGQDILKRLFEPLGYIVRAEHHALDEAFPEWGESNYYTVELEQNISLQNLLTHLYVLIPVLDAEKHYWVGQDEVEKLLRHGEGWLQAHPERELIVKRYLRYQKHLASEVLARLIGDEEAEPEAEQEKKAEQEEAIEKPIALNQLRLEAVLQAVTESAATRVIDLGCGEGRLLRELLKQKQVQEIAGMDVSHRSLEIASERLHFDTMPPKQKERIRLFQGSLMYRDKRLAGFETATAVEVIEHLDPPSLAAFERVVFEHAQPNTVIITTPNSEYNVRFETLPAGQFRHKDHRFEWTREQFQTWAGDVAQRYGYTVAFRSVGNEDAELGSPTQMGVFSRAAAN